MSLSKNPAFNLKAVLKETGIAADTLRAWERRYGLPTPQRTAGGHRLYSQYDVETIKWLMVRQAEGFSISRAVDLWNEHNASGTDPLAGYNPSNLIIASASSSNYLPSNTSLDVLRAQWIAACMKFNEAAAEQVLNQAFSMFPVEAVCIDLLQKGMVEIGSLWYENSASVQQEHFASSLAMRRLDALLSASPTPSRKQTILIGCPPNEWHAFIPLLLSLLLRRRGLGVIYLGANVPAERFEETITAVHADMVVLVAQTLISAAALQQTALTLIGLNTPVAYGGRIFNLRQNLKNNIPGHYLGDSVDASLEEIEKLLKKKNEARTYRPASKEYIAAHQAFISKRTHIESSFKEMLQPLPVSIEGISTGIQYLGDNIVAALQLGDMEHVTGELEWLKVLMQSHGRPSQELAHFINNYSLAVEQLINGSGTPIKIWLNEQAKQNQT